MTAGQNRIPVNLDYAASTPMRAEARLAQREYDDSELAGVNPNSLHSLGRKAAATLSEMKDLDEGLRILRKAASDGSVALDPAQVELLGKIMTNYTGTTLRELSGTLKDVMERQEALEAHLDEKKEAAPEINLQLTLVDPTKAVSDES